MGSLFAKMRAGAISKVDLDFERKVDPTELTPQCRATYVAVAECFAAADKALTGLQNYTDLKGAMKIVMDTSRSEEHKQALEAAMPSIKQIQDFYYVAQKINTEIPKLLTFLKSESLKDQEALCQVFSRLLGKMLEWDSAKVRQPSILNDFSFYRRNFSKMVEYDIPFPVLEQEANMISMFLAQPCPLAMGVAKTVKEARDEAARVVFANIANALCRAVTEEFQDAATLDFACSAMTCAAVVFDHSSDMGIFAGNEVKLRAIVDALGGYGERGETLLFFLKYNLKNFGQLCPAKIRSQFPGE